MEELAIRKPS